ncbi:MAG: LytTR family DNA-binding domain-containing protein [Oscillospiraceae bacterium]|nr:LytTR family DNA-binding domain-containing protein [Oscillospiraceae bacterium]
MLKIAVCDDNQEHRKEIQNAVSNILFEQDDLMIEVFADGAEVIDRIADGLFAFDLILLDIEMPGADGLAVAGTIRENDVATDIIFITRHEEYVYEGYKYKAFGYLTKPVSTSSLSAEINRYMREREDTVSKYLIITTNGCRQKLNMRHIDFVESSKRKISLVMGDSSLECYAKLDDIEQLCEGKLIRTHQSFLVNPERIRRMTKTDATLESGQVVPISKRYYQSAYKAFEGNYDEYAENGTEG